jgi:16S rRNA (cytosine967-C5)-methyltransferase
MRQTQSVADDPRALAAHVVARVLVDRRFLDDTLRELRMQRSDSLHDWALVQELTYGTLRWYHRLAGIAALFLERPLKPKDADVRALLLIGLYQLRHMRIADHASVGATVSAADALGKPWAKALINACLRTSLRESGRIERALATSEEMRYSHPAWLIAIIRQQYPSDWRRVLDADNERPPMVLRVNRARTTRDRYSVLLRNHGLHARPHARAEDALVLREAVSIDRLPGFHDGLVSVQDAAAQLAAIWLDARPTERVLDACAAPGGKAAHILERAPSLTELTAIDPDANRLDRVRANLARLGLSARLVVGDAAEPKLWWDGRPYDRILVDAPCSGSGVIRRHPDIKVRRRADDLPKLRHTQAAILDGVWPCLASGGKLLYATCSMFAEENELQVTDFLARHPDATVFPERIGAGAVGRQILPGEDGMDGFYYACVRKS